MPKEKKRKRAQDGSTAVNGDSVDTSKPSAIFQPLGGRQYTVSVALPGSIVTNAVSHDQKNFLIGTIARALAVFCVDEVVIFDDTPNMTRNNHANGPNGFDKYTAATDPCHFLAHLLSFLETPPYLRKTLFPMHPNLRTAGTLPSLDMPHHLRRDECCDYREGVVMSSSDTVSEVDIGLSERRQLNGIAIPIGTRVTLKLDKNSLVSTPVSPSEPREKAGIYWGYSLRRCNSLSTVLTECTFDGGYDLCIGTSERGTSLNEALGSGPPTFTHLMIVYGGVAGLETAARNDPELSKAGVHADNVNDLFDLWVNILPGQGSRTIRTEEAVWLGLMGLNPLVRRQITNSD